MHGGSLPKFGGERISPRLRSADLDFDDWPIGTRAKGIWSRRAAEKRQSHAAVQDLAELLMSRVRSTRFGLERVLFTLGLRVPGPACAAH